MELSPIIFKGPPANYELIQSSFGEYIYEKLKGLPPQKITHIHAETGEEMSNGQYLERSERVACGLEALNISVGDIVALLGENSMNISVALTACVLINAPFATLDPALKPYELGNIFESYQPKCVFCNEKEGNKIFDSLNSLKIKIPIILLDKEESSDSRFLGFGEVLKHGPKPTKSHTVKQLDKEMAIILPSSGSTGPPKGVAMSHKTAVNVVVRMLAKPVFAITFLQTSHLFWMSGLYALLGTFIGGSRIFVSELDLNHLLDANKKYKADMIFLSPSHLSTLMKSPLLTPTVLDPIKLVLTGGGPLQKWVADQFKEIFGMTKMLVQFYALTESCGNVTAFSPNGDVMSAGVIDDGIEIKIVDEVTENSLGEEKEGEIRVKHDYMMLGYVGKPEATQESFDEMGWLKTGDLGYMKKGLLYITGRIKVQIKYRNMQISPSEIEDLLLGLNGVADVGVEGIPHEEDQYHPMALIVKSPNSTITTEDIHKHVAEHLSAHKKLRGGIVFVDSIPRTTHFKLKRKDLKELALQLYPKSIKPT